MLGIQKNLTWLSSRKIQGRFFFFNVAFEQPTWGEVIPSSGNRGGKLENPDLHRETHWLHVKANVLLFMKHLLNVFPFYLFIFNWSINALSIPGSSVVKNPPVNAGDIGSIPGLERSLKKEMEIYSSILAWRILWTEESGRLQSLRSRNSQTQLSD